MSEVTFPENPVPVTGPEPEAPKKQKQSTRQVIFGVLSVFTALVIILIGLALLAPSLFLVVINILWLILIGIGLLFLLLGILVLVGMRKEVNSILDVMLEG